MCSRICFLTPDPIRCSNISNDTEIIWSTTRVKTKNSTGLNLGRRPDSKFVELFVFTVVVDQIISVSFEVASR